MSKTIVLSDAAYYDLVEFLSINKKSIDDNIPHLVTFWNEEKRKNPDDKMTLKSMEQLADLKKAGEKYGRIIAELRGEEGKKKEDD